ncbi:MAG: multiheme c-type cytochrome, partial [Acidobacteriota bacterium]
MNRRILFALSIAAAAQLAAAQKPAQPAARAAANAKTQAPAPTATGAPMTSAAPNTMLAPATTTAAPAPVEPSGTPGQFIGVASCANSGCHGSTLPLQSTHVLQNEYYTWLNSDRHAQAYNVLFNDRSARVARNMHLTRKAYQEAVCLECHSTNVAPRMVSGHIDPEDGVQCEACHGPAGGWRAEHTQAGWTHEQSVGRGMADLRQLPTRASSCLSCHLGDSKREVDHELIASGHP